MPEFWRTQLQQLDAGSLWYSVIGPFDSRCQVDAPDLDGGHEASVRAFQGLREDICRPWASSFSGGVWIPRTTFFLSATPQPETLIVRLDGVVLAPTNAMGVEHWRYVSAINAVRLLEDIVEGDSEQMTVMYEKVCF